jgi:hypothetical protein
MYVTLSITGTAFHAKYIPYCAFRAERQSSTLEKTPNPSAMPMIWLVHEKRRKLASKTRKTNSPH